MISTAPDRAAPELRVVVMGVAGAGKTTVGRRLAERFAAGFVDADDLHPTANVEKMTAGIPLTDADRGPWLERLRDAIEVGSPVVATCSALARRYRDVLREVGGVTFVLLDVPPEVASDRVETRPGHFMPVDLVSSQFAAFERPVDEPDVVTIDARGPIDDVVTAASRALGSPAG